MAIRFEDIIAAAERIAGAVFHSPCPPSIPLSEATGCRMIFELRGDVASHRGECGKQRAQSLLGLVD